MNERTASPDRFSDNPAYAAILGNQQVWNEASPGFKYGREVKALSRGVEKRLKTVFAGYIDPGYPQITINITAGYHPKRYANDYTYTPFRFPEHVQETDRPDYKSGMFELNEWATTYATSHFWKTMEKGPLSTPLMRGYRSMNHTAMDRGSAPYAIKVMEDVAKTTGSMKADFDYAVFSALFKHDTSALDDLIKATETVKSNSLEELALEIVRRPKKKLAEVAKGYSFQAKEGDSRIKSTAKNALISATTHGWQAVPGIVEINLTMGGFGPALGSGLATTGDIGAALLGTLLGTAAASFPYPATAIHEAIHGYSLGKNNHGLMPITLEK